jgi:hypothetical protein
VQVLAIDTAILVLGIVGVVAAVVAIVVIVSPWKGVRDEQPLPEDVETRLLLGEDPAVVAADVDATEGDGASVHDLNGDADEEKPATNGDAAFKELQRLDDESAESADDASERPTD